jgi:hypothetical protein
MKQTLRLNIEQHSLVKDAMGAFREGLERMDQRLFDIAFNKILTMENSVELDGMEMIFITQALNKFAKNLIINGQYVKSEPFRMLGMEIEDIRFNFQYQNAPQIIKSKRTQTA